MAKKQQRYNSLVYQLENNLYDNDNDLGKKELYNEVREWNEDRKCVVPSKYINPEPRHYFCVLLLLDHLFGILHQEYKI